MAKLGNCNLADAVEELSSVNEQVCLTVNLIDSVEDNFSTFYTNSTDFAVNGTVVVTNNVLGDGSSSPVELVVNFMDTEDFLIYPGQTKSFTLSGIETLSIEVESTTPVNATVEVSFSLNYKF